jgi:hypothetical protein
MKLPRKESSTKPRTESSILTAADWKDIFVYKILIANGRVGWGRRNEVVVMCRKEGKIFRTKKRGGLYLE